MAEKVIPVIIAPQLLFLHHSSSDISTWCHPKMTFFMDESKYSPVMFTHQKWDFPRGVGGEVGVLKGVRARHTYPPLGPGCQGLGGG